MKIQTDRRDRLNEEEEGAARDLARWRRVEGFGEGGRDSSDVIKIQLILLTDKEK